MKTGIGERRSSGLVRTVLALTALVVSVASWAGCDESPTRPGVTRNPGGLQLPVVTAHIEVSAPFEIATGDSVQLTATAVKSDGSTENVSNRTAWTSSNTRVVEVSAAGVARAVANGEAAIIGRFEGWSASSQTLVVPHGTYRLTGRVSVSGVPISDVLLTVVSGIGADLTVISGSDGGYALYGVSGPIRIQAKKEGFVNRTGSLEVSRHAVFDLDLEFEGRPPDLAGTYTLTVDAAPCLGRQTLPAGATSRSYTARLTQQGVRLDVTLSDADFIISGARGNRFAGFVEPSGAVTFDIVGDLDVTNDPYYFFGEHDLSEHFGDNEALLVSGRVNAKATGAAISGRLNGTISVAPGTKPPFEADYAATCRSDAHPFELRRR